MDPGHDEHFPDPHASQLDQTITRPNSNGGRLYLVDSKAVHKHSNAGEAEHQCGGGEREVATSVLSCPTVYTMSLVQEMLNEFLKCFL